MDDEGRHMDPRIKLYEKKLRRLASELSLVEARERREIASDLHDHIGQALAYVSQKVSRLQGNSIFSGMDDEFSEIRSILRQTIQYTRDLTMEISPPVLYELGLEPALEELAERSKKMHGLDVRASKEGTIREVSEDVKVFMFKSVQELIVNASKHADASEVKIHSRWQEETLEITVSDDGKGFDPARCEGGFTGDDCFGLFSIRERLSYIGGSFEIDSSPGKGTRVSIVCPYGAGKVD